MGFGCFVNDVSFVSYVTYVKLMKLIHETLPEHESRFEVARKCKLSVDTIDNAIKSDTLDYIEVSANNKPVVKNEKYNAFLLLNGYKSKKKK